MSFEVDIQLIIIYTLLSNFSLWMSLQRLLYAKFLKVARVIPVPDDALDMISKLNRGDYEEKNLLSNK